MTEYLMKPQCLDISLYADSAEPRLDIWAHGLGIHVSTEEGMALLGLLKNYFNSPSTQLNSLDKARFDNTRTVKKFRGILCNSDEHPHMVELYFNNECSLLLTYEVARELKECLVSGHWTFEQRETLLQEDK